MSTISYWNLSAEKHKYPALEENLETGILIIGGGITGITCAYCLAEKGFKPVLIEAGGLCDGTTGNTTGKVTIQHDDIYSTLEKKYGLKAAKNYAESQTKAVEFVKRLVKTEAFDCQFELNTSFLYAASEEDLQKIEDEYDIASRLGIDAVLSIAPDFPPNNFGMLGYKNQAVFHPVRYAEALAKAAVSFGARIYCGTKAIEIKDGDIKTVFCENDIEIKTKHLVMSTQYPFYDGPNLFYTRLYPKRSYGIAVKAARSWPDGSYINLGGAVRSIRTHVENGERILIVVGDGHYTGRGEKDMDSHFENLYAFADSIAVIREVLAKWSAQDYDTPDKLPYIGRISDNSNIYVAAGYRKWGLTTGTLAGIMLTDLISSGNCEYEGLYSKSRSDFLSSPAETLTGIFGPVAELVKSKLEKSESIKGLERGEGCAISFEGRKAGIYRDFDDSVTIIDISCTHMSTELNFNNAEKTWDCPAHGGRFNTDGKLLEGPPKDNLEIYYRGRYSDLYEK